MWLRSSMAASVWHGTSLREFQGQFQWPAIFILMLTGEPSPVIRHISVEGLSLGEWKAKKEVASFPWCLWICAQTRNLLSQSQSPTTKHITISFAFILNLGYKNGPQMKGKSHLIIYSSFHSSNICRVSLIKKGVKRPTLDLNTLNLHCDIGGIAETYGSWGLIGSKRVKMCQIIYKVPQS